MSGNDQVDLAGGELGDDLSLPRRGDTAREEFELERVGREAAAERFDVLQGEHGGWHQHGDLSPRLEHGEGGAQRHLGLAVANIAHDHAVHRARSTQVTLRCLDGGELIGRFAIREGRLKLGKPWAPWRNRWAMRQLARGVDAQQLIGEIVGRLLGALLGAAPLATTESTELRMLRAGVARDACQLLHWREDGVGAAIGNLQVVALIAVTTAAQHAHETANAVIHMHQVVARRESLRRLAGDTTTVHRRSTNTCRAEELAICDHRQPINTALESAVEAAGQNRERARLRVAEHSFAHHRALATLGDQLSNARRLLRNDQYPRLVASPGFKALGECARSPARHHRVVPAE